MRTAARSNEKHSWTSDLHTRIWNHIPMTCPFGYFLTPFLCMRVYNRRYWIRWMWIVRHVNTIAMLNTLRKVSRMSFWRRHICFKLFFLQYFHHSSFHRRHLTNTCWVFQVTRAQTIEISVLHSERKWMVTTRCVYMSVFCLTFLKIEHEIKRK